MARSRQSDSDLRVSGLQLWARFTLSMTAAMAVVMAIAGWLLFSSATSLARGLQEAALVEAVRLSALGMEQGKDFFQQGHTATRLGNGNVQRFRVRYGDNVDGFLYQVRTDDDVFNLIVPQRIGQDIESGLLGLIVGTIAAVLFMAFIVSYFVANQVSEPLGTLIEDIRQIAHGNLRHKTRVRAGGEIALLAKTVDRMAASLDEAQEATLELSVRDREIEVAGEVREALLPEVTPYMENFDVGAKHIASSFPGGDFHDYIEHEDGRVGLLACDVSGAGVPGALVGATARAYLRAILTDSDDVEAAFRTVNRELAHDVRRGMFVTAIYALVDPRRNVATVVCAGHKMPLLRYTAEDQKVRLVQPEGIALGFDPGPVFDRTLTVQEVPLAPGDRLVLANTGPLKVVDPDGQELGEKEFFRLVLRHSTEDTMSMLRSLGASLEEFADDEAFPNDISLVSIARSV